MKMLAVVCLAAMAACAGAQVPDAAKVQAELRAATEGQWVGVLEYRDYAEPETSTKRVALPTWLTISGGTWKYVYDDGPNKVLEETDEVTFDVAKGGYSEAANGKPAQACTATGYEALKAGRGTLVITCEGKDNDKPSEQRVTMTIRRNLIDILEEVRPKGSTGAFAFRHAFRFVRATVPVVTGSH